MATKAKGGLLLPLLLLGGVVAYVSVDGVGDSIGGLLGSDPVVVGTGREAIMVADGAAATVKECTPKRLVAERRCGDLKVIVMDAAKMPYITRNVSLAWSEGRDFILTRSGRSRDANYKAACGKFVKKYTDGSCDEYEFASTTQGGSGARIEEVPAREQDCQGGRSEAPTGGRVYGRVTTSWWSSATRVRSPPSRIEGRTSLRTRHHAGTDREVRLG